MTNCVACQQDKELDAFERTGNGDNRRRTCKECRKTVRITSVADATNVEARQEPIPPERCTVCNNPPSNMHVFELRRDRVGGQAYRTTCNRCRNQARRQRRVVTANATNVGAA